MPNASGWQSSRNKESNHNSRKEQHRMVRLVSAIQEVSLTRNLESVMRVVRRAARELAAADGATFVLRDIDQCYYADEDAISPLWKGRRFPMTACISGWAMLNQRAAVIADIYADPRIPIDAYRPTFVKSLVMVPIRTEAPIGAIGVYWARPYRARPDEVQVLQALADSTSIAIENVQLFADLGQAQRNLEQAYDATLEGWSRALDLRDEETQGHSLRVTELTVRLAQVLGVPEEEIRQIRRGALLHDIGKMGVPDAILLKPGPLTPDEWQIMRQHPVHSYELLAPIAYLHPALAIPYSHHEKWDGSGYPQGLSGEQIPLAARIFAVVDVWDAMTNDRPYRRAMPPAEALAQIASLAGTHFDPMVVDAFLRLMQ